MAKPVKKENVFFDIHCHAINLSHVGFLAFVNRFLLRRNVGFSELSQGRFFKIFWSLFLSSVGGTTGNWIKRIFFFVVDLLSFILASVSIISLWILHGSRYLFDEPHLEFDLIKTVLWGFLSLVCVILLAIAVWFFINRKKLITHFNRLLNLVSLTENDIGTQFILMEEDIVRMDDEAPLVPQLQDFSAEKKRRSKKTIVVNYEEFHKFLLTPLVLDFGYKGRDQLPGIYYNRYPVKPVEEQVVDLFNGIKSYVSRSAFHLLEIYPFLGINTRHYSLGIVLEDYNSALKRSLDKLDRELGDKVYYLRHLDKVIIFDKIDRTEQEKWVKSLPQDTDEVLKELLLKALSASRKEAFFSKNNIPKMLHRYFSAYTGNYREFQKQFMSSYYNDRYIFSAADVSPTMFAGIKLYPPLGFDPWPVKDRYEFEKVNFLYQFCEDRRIPITSHCAREGFVVSPYSDEFSHPDKWKSILPVYRNLKLNLAHMGGVELPAGRKKGEWTAVVFDLLKSGSYPFLFTDFSYRGYDKKFYASLKQWLNDLSREERGQVESRILFGSDFSINLIEVTSYKEYLINYFNNSDNGGLSDNLLLKFCTENPQRFLFNSSL